MSKLPLTPGRTQKCMIETCNGRRNSTGYCPAHAALRRKEIKNEKAIKK